MFQVYASRHPSEGWGLHALLHEMPACTGMTVGIMTEVEGGRISAA